MVSGEAMYFSKTFICPIIEIERHSAAFSIEFVSITDFALLLKPGIFVQGAVLQTVRMGMFDDLSVSLNKAWDIVRKDGKLTADNIKGPMREIRRALLEADVCLSSQTLAAMIFPWSLVNTTPLFAFDACRFNCATPLQSPRLARRQCLCPILNSCIRCPIGLFERLAPLQASQNWFI